MRLAKADQHYAVEEIQLIDRLIAGHLDLNPVEAAKLRATSEKLEASAPPDTPALSAMVQGEISEPDRHAVLDALWQVGGLADRALKPEEESLLGEVAAALGGLDPAEGAARNRTVT